jgi:hypothetical protein
VIDNHPLTALGPDLYGLDGEVSPPGLKLPARMTVLRTSDGSIALHSPLAMDDATARAVEALGPVRWIIAPSLMHHLFAAGAKQRFPQAKLLGAPGLADKRKDLAFDGVLPERGEPLGPDTGVECRLVEGMPGLNEVVFFHRASRAVIFTDLLFNVRSSPHFGTRLMLSWLSGVYGRCAVSRLVKWGTKDRAAAARGLDDVRAWRPERIVMAHGEPVLPGAPGSEDVGALLERELAWFYAPAGR